MKGTPLLPSGAFYKLGQLSRRKPQCLRSIDALNEGVGVGASKPCRRHVGNAEVIDKLCPTGHDVEGILAGVDLPI